MRNLSLPIVREPVERDAPGFLFIGAGNNADAQTVPSEGLPSDDDA